MNIRTAFQDLEEKKNSICCGVKSVQNFISTDNVFLSSKKLIYKSYINFYFMYYEGFDYKYVNAPAWCPRSSEEASDPQELK